MLAATTEISSNNCSSCSASVAAAGRASVQLAGAFGGCLSVRIGNVGENTGSVLVDICLGGGISISFGSINTNTGFLSAVGQDCAAGPLTVQSTHVIASHNNVADCAATNGRNRRISVRVWALLCCRRHKFTCRRNIHQHTTNRQCQLHRQRQSLRQRHAFRWQYCVSLQSAVVVSGCAKDSGGCVVQAGWRHQHFIWLCCVFTIVF